MNLLDKVTDTLIKELIGEDAVSLVNLIKKKSNVSEFKIAEKLNLGINQVRNILYRLYSHNLIDFTRKKDKKKGWYIYYWTFNIDRINELIIKDRKKKIENLKNLIMVLERENFFICVNDNVTFSFENAMEHNFRCPECGEVLKQKENKKEIEKNKIQLKTLEADFNEIQIELEKFKKKKETIEARKKKLVKKKVIKRKPKKKVSKKLTKRTVTKKRIIKKLSKSKKPKKLVKKKVIKRKPKKKKSRRSK